MYPAVERSLVATAAPDDASRVAVLRELGVASGRRIALYAGNWSERLGVMEALEVFATVARTVDDVDLVVANRLSLRGSQAEEEARVRAVFDARVAELGIGARVQVVGLLPDFRRVIAASSALLFPALDLREGKLDLPLVVLEAVALGVPVALYDIAPIDEFPFAAAGAVAVPGDRSGLAGSLTALLADAAAHAAPRPPGARWRWSTSIRVACAAPPRRLRTGALSWSRRDVAVPRPSPPGLRRRPTLARCSRRARRASRDRRGRG